MMQIFHIKGFQGILVFLVALIAAFSVFFALPAAVMMIFWNATVFEMLNGPEMNIFQGFIFWLAILVLFKIIFKPEIHFEFRQVGSPEELDKINQLNKRD